MDKEALDALFDKYIRKLRITPEWDIKLEFVEDRMTAEELWRKFRLTGSYESWAFGDASRQTDFEERRNLPFCKQPTV